MRAYETEVLFVYKAGCNLSVVCRSRAVVESQKGLVRLKSAASHS